MSQRVYVFVSGGVVDHVEVPVTTNGTHTVVDWDNIESDPRREWDRLDEEDRAYLREACPEEFGHYFEEFAK